MTPPRLVALIRHAMPEDGVVCLDNGLYKVGHAAHSRSHTYKAMVIGCQTLSTQRVLHK